MFKIVLQYSCILSQRH